MPAQVPEDIKNLWLGALPAGDSVLLSHEMTRVWLKRDQILVLPDRMPEYVYFPEGGIGSIVLESSDLPLTEVGIFGREGMSGMSALLGVGESTTKTVVQIGESTALRVPLAAMQSALAESVTLRTSFLHYAHVMVTQLAYSVVSNARYPLEARLARWLLMCHDRVDGDTLLLTHQFMSIMVGAQRTGVTMTLHVLEARGLIESLRARVVIINRKGLENLAGSSYGTGESEYRRLIAPFGRENDSAS